MIFHNLMCFLVNNASGIFIDEPTLSGRCCQYQPDYLYISGFFRVVSLDWVDLDIQANFFQIRLDMKKRNRQQPGRQASTLVPRYHGYQYADLSPDKLVSPSSIEDELFLLCTLL